MSDSDDDRPLCTFWAQGRCRKSAERCSYRHGTTVEDVFEVLNTECSHGEECRFWKRGQCLFLHCGEPRSARSRVTLTRTLMRVLSISQAEAKEAVARAGSSPADHLDEE